MALSEKFNTEYRVEKNGEGALSLRFGDFAGSNYLTYDFNLRLLFARTGASESGLTVTPFSQLDRESLEDMREKLIELGGHPPELPIDKRATPQPPKGGMNL
ncbi:MAG: hypothetical protein GC185_02730 [Alphaproteobacteria bacterium]|nr:hypothetical protein [Alphaproteobacteria bacterium]